MLRRALLLACLGSAWAAADDTAPLPAEPARLAAQGLLIAAARAGERLVAVGDRGVIVYSDDRGTSWRQASVPTQALLTGVCFLDARHGIAVGHDLVALASADAGASWQLTHYDVAAERPLLDVWCGREGHAIAVGAYSTYLTSSDGGRSWQGVPFQPRPVPRAAARPQDAGAARSDYHLNRIVGELNTLYIAAEAGHLYRSDDGGGSWQELPSPYEGSFFGVLPVGAEALLAYGLRGNLFRSDDGGQAWRALPSGTVATLDGAARLKGAGVVLVGLAGTVLLSRDAGQHFDAVPVRDHADLSQVLALDARTLLLVGEDGARRLALPPEPGDGP